MVAGLGRVGAFPRAVAQPAWVPAKVSHPLGAKWTFESVLQLPGQRAFHRHHLVGDRVVEAKHPGMQRNAPHGIGLGAVAFVADDRTTCVAEVDAYLVATARDENELQQRAVANGLHQAIVRDRLTGVWPTGCAPDAQRVALVEMRLEGPSRRRRTPLHDRVVLLLDALPAGCSVSWASAVLANTMRPEVSRSNRCTIQMWARERGLPPRTCSVSWKYALRSRSPSLAIDNRPEGFSITMTASSS